MRLQPLPADEWDEAVQRSLSGMLPPERCNPRDAGTALSTFANHPALAKAFLRFNVHLVFVHAAASHPRTGHPACRNIVATARTNGPITWPWPKRQDYAMTRSPRFAGALMAGPMTSFERAVITGVDELDEKSQLSDATWAALGERLIDRQRMDFVFTVGCYTLLAMAFNTFGVQVENAAEGGNKTDNER